jgi:hypothetical protein
VKGYQPTKEGSFVGFWALPGIVLYCLLYCIVLYCIVLYCIVLYCVVLYCIVLYCIVCMYSPWDCLRVAPHVLNLTLVGWLVDPGRRGCTYACAHTPVTFN